MENDLENRLQAALDACARMQDQRDQLASQLKDATAQCGVMAGLLREVIVRDDFDREDGDSAGKLLYRIDAALAGKLPEPRITKPARVWGARFMPGVSEKTIIEAAYRYAEYEASEEEKRVGKINFDLLMAAVHRTVPEGWQLVPVEPTTYQVLVGRNAKQDDDELCVAIYRAMLAAAPKPEANNPGHSLAMARVCKTGGSFQHTGTVVAEFRTLAGEPRIVMEFDAPVAGMLHIYRPDQVDPLEGGA